MQNRRIIDRILRSAGVEPAPTLQSNSMVVLYSHIRTGRWTSIMPAVLADNGLTQTPQREPMTPLLTVLVAEARKLAISSA